MIYRTGINSSIPKVEENDGPIYFLTLLEAFNVMWDILSNLDDNDTLFLYREQNEQ